jgi:hypothetical protein
MNEKIPELRLQFFGDKKGLKKQFKIWCAKNDKEMTPTVLELIDKHLKENK